MCIRDSQLLAAEVVGTDLRKRWEPTLDQAPRLLNCLIAFWESNCRFRFAKSEDLLEPDSIAAGPDNFRRLGSEIVRWALAESHRPPFAMDQIHLELAVLRIRLPSRPASLETVEIESCFLIDSVLLRRIREYLIRLYSVGQATLPIGKHRLCRPRWAGDFPALERRQDSAAGGGNWQAPVVLDAHAAASSIGHPIVGWWRPEPLIAAGVARQLGTHGLDASVARHCPQCL